MKNNLNKIEQNNLIKNLLILATELAIITITLLLVGILGSIDDILIIGQVMLGVTALVIGWILYLDLIYSKWFSKLTKKEINNSIVNKK